MLEIDSHGTLVQLLRKWMAEPSSIHMLEPFLLARSKDPFQQTSLSCLCFAGLFYIRLFLDTLANVAAFVRSLYDVLLFASFSKPLCKVPVNSNNS